MVHGVTRRDQNDHGCILLHVLADLTLMLTMLTLSIDVEHERSGSRGLRDGDAADFSDEVVRQVSQPAHPVQPSQLTQPTRQAKPRMFSKQYLH